MFALAMPVCAAADNRLSVCLRMRSPGERRLGPDAFVEVYKIMRSASGQQVLPQRLANRCIRAVPVAGWLAWAVPVLQADDDKTDIRLAQLIQTPEQVPQTLVAKPAS